MPIEFTAYVAGGLLLRPAPIAVGAPVSLFPMQEPVSGSDLDG
jgi:hypothetical protein